MKRLLLETGDTIELFPCDNRTSKPKNLLALVIRGPRGGWIGSTRLSRSDRKQLSEALVSKRSLRACRNLPRRERKSLLFRGLPAPS